jgi:hypothetical protein
MTWKKRAVASRVKAALLEILVHGLIMRLVPLRDKEISELVLNMLDQQVYLPVTVRGLTNPVLKWSLEMAVSPAFSAWV